MHFGMFKKGIKCEWIWGFVGLNEQAVLCEQKLVTFILFIPFIVNDLHILTVPTNTQFSYYVFHSILPNLEWNI